MESIGPYRILEEIARGGMGIVYRGLDPQLQREVALKVLLTPQAEESDRRRFQEEAQATARLRHPSIVGIQSAGVAGGRPYLVMDLVQGESLYERLKRQVVLDPREAAELTRRLAEGLHYAHNHGVIHRDIKPANVLIDRDGTPLLTDFGLARILGRDERITLTGEVLGTPYYMSPEQAAGYLDQIGPLTDVYSLGATLYEMLTGHPPFQSDSVIATLDSVITKSATPITDLRPGVDERLKAICMRCMAKKAEDRYPSARALAEDLTRFLLLEEEEEVPRAKGSLPLQAGLFLGGLLAGALVTLLVPRPQTAPRERPAPASQEKTQAEAPDPVAERARIESDVTLRYAEQLDGHDKRLALRILDAAIARHPTPLLHSQRAMARLRTRDLSGAMADCARALELDPRCHQALESRAAVLSEQGKQREALRAVAAALELAPSSARAHDMRGLVWQRLGNGERALKSFDTSVELDPKRARSWLHRGMWFHVRGRHREALENYDKALALNPELRNLHNMRGRAFLFLGRHQEALKSFARSLQLNPVDPGLYAWRGKLYRKMGERKRELADFERLVLLLPEDAKSIVERGIARENNGDPKGALADYTRAIELDPKARSAYFNRARIRLDKRDRTGALADLRKARPLFRSTHPLSQRIRSMIRTLEDEGH